MTAMGDYTGDCDDEAELIRFANEAKEGWHTCENCANNETDLDGQYCTVSGSDFRNETKTGGIPYAEECRPRDCPKWALRTKSEREINSERMTKFLQHCAEDKKTHCLCGQCKSKTCLEKGRIEIP